MTYHYYRRPTGGYLRLSYDKLFNGYKVDNSFVTKAQILGNGYTQIHEARFIDVSRPREPLHLPYDITYQRVFYKHHWHEAKTLGQYLGVRYSPNTQQLKSHGSPRFGAEPKQPEWVTTKHRKRKNVGKFI